MGTSVNKEMWVKLSPLVGGGCRILRDVDPRDRPLSYCTNTPGRGSELRPLRIGRHNLAQCFEACKENGGGSSKNGVRTALSAFLTVGFRTDGAGTPVRTDSRGILTGPCWLRILLPIQTRANQGERVERHLLEEFEALLDLDSRTVRFPEDDFAPFEPAV